jgi:hypothetical protein
MPIDTRPASSPRLSRSSAPSGRTRTTRSPAAPPSAAASAGVGEARYYLRGGSDVKTALERRAFDLSRLDGADAELRTIPVAIDLSHQHWDLQVSHEHSRQIPALQFVRPRLNIRG